MNDDKHHFNNGTEMEVSFPTQIQEFTWRARGSRQEHPKLRGQNH